MCACVCVLRMMPASLASVHEQRAAAHMRNFCMFQEAEKKPEIDPAQVPLRCWRFLMALCRLSAGLE